MAPPNPPNSEPWPELEERLGAGEGVGVEMERISPREFLAGVKAERADLDLRMGVVEHEPFVVGLPVAVPLPGPSSPLLSLVE